MGSWLRSRVPGVVVAVLLLAGLGGPSLAAPVDAQACPGQPLSVAELHRLQGDDGLLILADVNHAGRRCYGSAEIRVVAFSGTPPIMGWEGPWYLEPGWLGDIGLAIYDRTVTRDQWMVPSYRLAWHGPYRELQTRYQQEWVAITAHFDDPAARTCHATGSNRPSRASLVRQCRSVLVIDTVRSLGSMDTATGPVADVGAGTQAIDGDWRSTTLLVAAMLGAVVWIVRTRGRESKRPGR